MDRVASYFVNKQRDEWVHQIVYHVVFSTSIFSTLLSIKKPFSPADVCDAIISSC